MKIFSAEQLVILFLVLTSLSQADTSKQIPEGMALVPAGSFQMGNNNDYYDNDFDEQPRHVVNLPPYYVDVYPVTNQDYKVFVDATGHRSPKYWKDSSAIPAGKEKHPVTGVNYFDAIAYASWKGRRLPTEQEWEKASRGSEGLRWPWGHAFDKSKANVGQHTTTPVDAYPQGCNTYGLCDIAGNVWEWTSTWYAPYPNAPENRAILRFLNDQYLSVRGGSYGSDIGSARGADRGIKKPLDLGPSMGFRTVLDVPGHEGYREALQTIELAKITHQQVVLDISDYEEHANSRQLMIEASAKLVIAEKAFTQKQFMDAGMLAQYSISKAKKAQQLALDVRSDYQIKKETKTKEVLGQLEAMLSQLPKQQQPAQQALFKQVKNHLRQGRQLEAEGGWGYAQMHGYIGMGMLKGLQ
jgi:iron(II)-dependent oxidoreductase